MVGRSCGHELQTVKNHVSSILRKLSVNDRTQAVVYAIRRAGSRCLQLANQRGGLGSAMRPCESSMI